MPVPGCTHWKNHKFQIADIGHETDELGEALDKAKEYGLANKMATLLRSEHLNLLVGNGLTLAIAGQCGASGSDLTAGQFKAPYFDAVHLSAKESAGVTGRGDSNLEDDIRAALQLLGGLRVLAKTTAPPPPHFDVRSLLADWEAALGEVLTRLARSVLATEEGIKKSLEANPGHTALKQLASLLVAFGMRPSSRERLHIFTTNYDRLLEYACDLLGMQVLDRFVGRLEPMFRASRLNVDLHYNPPGIRGEPRYLQGVVRMTKLHGSLDWRQADTAVGPGIIRTTLPFGAGPDHPDLPGKLALMIYPNPAKDRETLEYPYAELFRDFSAALCQPNATLFTYGYGFDDDHINRVIADMLTLPATHLVIISYDTASGRIPTFYRRNGQSSKISLLIGKHFGSLADLTEYYLPRADFESTPLSTPSLPSPAGAA